MQIIVNTLNLLEGDKLKPYNIFVPFLSNKIVIQKAKKLKKVLEGFGLLENNLFGLSGHPCRMNNMGEISAVLSKYNIPMISVDTPDITQFWDDQVKTDLFRGNFFRVAVHMVWRAYNVQSINEFKKRIKDALSYSAVVYGNRFLRANSASFCTRKELGEGEVLKKIMAENADLKMALEIDGNDYEKMEDFYQLIKELNYQFPDRVGVSFDPGHVLIMYHRKKCDTPEKELDELIKSGLPIFSFEIDQAKYNPDAQKDDERVELHTLPWDGDMDMAGMLKKYLSTLLPKNAQHHIVLEVSPIHWDKFIAGIGSYLKDII